MSKTNERYTGHNATGGLQKHSTGPSYPWTVIGQGSEPIEYRAYHCTTAQQGPLRATYRQAHDDVQEYVERARLAQAVNRGVRTWGDTVAAWSTLACDQASADQVERRQADRRAAAPRATSNYHEIPLANGEHSTGPRVGPSYTLTLADAIELGQSFVFDSGPTTQLAAIGAGYLQPAEALRLFWRSAGDKYEAEILERFDHDQIRTVNFLEGLGYSPTEIVEHLRNTFGE